MFRIARALAVLALVALFPDVPGVAAQGYAVNPALQAAPGYKPLVDPDSMSVRLGRRPDAPVVGMRFRFGATSMEHLGRMLTHAIHHTSVDSLRRLCITREEFNEIMWREFPQSRPVTGLHADDAWFMLDGRLREGVSKLLSERGGQDLTFVRWDRADTVAIYRNFRLHNGLSLVVRDESGKEVALAHVRAVAERKGQFKLQSLRD